MLKKKTIMNQIFKWYYLNQIYYLKIMKQIMKVNAYHIHYGYFK